MSTTLKQRVEALEAKYAELLQVVQDKPAKDAWRKVVGMFANDPAIGDIHAETQRIREADRAATRDTDLSAESPWDRLHPLFNRRAIS